MENYKITTFYTLNPNKIISKALDFIETENMIRECNSNYFRSKNVNIEKPMVTDTVKKEPMKYDMDGDFIYYETVREAAEGLIDKVIFSNPATIVFWKTGEKTIVKAQSGDTFDKEKGIAMAFFKYMFGNKGSYMSVINHIIDHAEDEDAKAQAKLDKIKSK